MELRYSGQFNRDIALRNRKLSKEIRNAIRNIKNASSIDQIHHLKKLHKYQTHYRIRVAEYYRIGVIIRGNIVYFVRFGQRSIFYKKLFP